MDGMADDRDARIAQLEAEVRQLREQQAATAEILGVIASSPTDPDSVGNTLQSIIEVAGQLCDAEHGQIVQLDESDGRLHILRGGLYGVFLERANRWRRETGHTTVYGGPGVAVSRDALLGRAFLDRRTIMVPDVATQDEIPLARQSWWSYFERGLHSPRTQVGVPLLLRGEAIGVLHLCRSEVRPFSERDIALLETFADQAVIAIENARLFEQVEHRNHDLAEALERQTATAEVLRVIASSPVNLRPCSMPSRRASCA